MRIAYLVSRYPAPSHTFIEREIRALSDLGVEILRFSVRKPGAADVLGERARAEAAQTRWLVPPPPIQLATAVVATFVTQPAVSLRVLADAIGKARGRQKLKWLMYYFEGVLLAWMLKRAGAEHLHCHFGNSGSNTAMIAARLAGLPMSITFHGIDLDEPMEFRHGEKVRECAFAVCISERGRETLLQSAPEAAGKVHVVRCGYPAAAADAVPPMPERNRIVCVARLAPEKGHCVLLGALNELKTRGRDFHCTLVGGGPLEREIVAHIAKAGLSGHVTMTGALAPAGVAQHLADADLVVLASLGEGIPVVLMEAFALQRPVVATRVGGISELVVDGESGRLVEPGDAIALADALEWMLSDPERARALGKAGWQTLRAKHDPRSSAEQMRQLFAGAVRPLNRTAAEGDAQGEPQAESTNRGMGADNLAR